MGFDPRRPFEKRKTDIFFVFFGIVVILHAVRIFYIFYTTLKPSSSSRENSIKKDHSGQRKYDDRICSVQGILINRYYSDTRFLSNNLLPPIKDSRMARLFSMEFNDLGFIVCEIFLLSLIL